MRRLVLIVMMCLLPLQWSWAAAASVCQHDSCGAHFGHHEHKHAETDGDTGDTSPGSHPDCKVCQGMGAAYAPALQPLDHDWLPDPQRSAYGGYLPEPPFESFLRPPLPLVA